MQNYDNSNFLCTHLLSTHFHSCSLSFVRGHVCHISHHIFDPFISAFSHQLPTMWRRKRWWGAWTYFVLTIVASPTPKNYYFELKLPITGHEFCEKVAISRIFGPGWVRNAKNVCRKLKFDVTLLCWYKWFFFATLQSKIIEITLLWFRISIFNLQLQFSKPLKWQLIELWQY